MTPPATRGGGTKYVGFSSSSFYSSSSSLILFLLPVLSAPPLRCCSLLFSSTGSSNFKFIVFLDSGRFLKTKRAGYRAQGTHHRRSSIIRDWGKGKTDIAPLSMSAVPKSAPRPRPYPLQLSSSYSHSYREVQAVASVARTRTAHTQHAATRNTAGKATSEAAEAVWAGAYGLASHACSLALATRIRLMRLYHPVIAL